MKTSLYFKAFLEAAGVATYIVIFALIAESAQTWFVAKNIFPDPFLSIVIFLLAFVISAFVCGSLVLLYPTRLFFEGKKESALRILLASAGWLVVFLIIFIFLILIAG